jgi:hypothetical protein
VLQGAPLLEAPQLLEVVLRAEVLQAGTEVLRSGTEVLQGTPLLQNPLLQAGLRTEVRLRSAQGLVLGE